MKKHLSLLILSFLFIPLIIIAQDAPIESCDVSSEVVLKYSDTCGDLTSASDCKFSDDAECAICCLFSAIHAVTGWVFTGVMVISTIVVLFGAFTITTAGGDPSKVSSGRSYILYAMIGFAVALFATAIPALVEGLLGVE